MPPVTGLYCDSYDHSSVLAAPLQVANVEEEQVRSAKKQMQRGGRGDSVGPEGGAGGEAEERRDSQGKTSPKKQQWALGLPGTMDLGGAGGLGHGDGGLVAGDGVGTGESAGVGVAEASQPSAKV